MPFDFSSFFTPRFPVRNRAEEPLGPELPPDFYAIEEQKKLPEWKKRIASMGEQAYDYTVGALGLPGQPTTRASEYGELTSAGIPFLALGKKLKLPEVMGKPVVWRGDPGINSRGVTYQEINPQYFNRQDTLGYMGHAAENKDYAIKSYMHKEGSPYPPNQMENYSLNRRARPNLTAVTAPSSVNAVDLTKLPEDPVDVEKLVRGLELWQPHKSPFGSADRLNTKQKAQDLAEEIPYLWRTQQQIDKKLREGTPLTMRDRMELDHIGDKMDDIRIPLNDPEITDKLGFDAIRYTDVNQPSWAFPDVSKMETPWGTKLGQKSMGEYPYRVLGREQVISGKDPFGHFKTKKDAIKAAVGQGTGSKIYLGNEEVAKIPYKMNYGLEDYLKADKKIQQSIKKAPELKKLPEEWEKESTGNWAELNDIDNPSYFVDDALDADKIQDLIEAAGGKSVKKSSFDNLTPNQKKILSDFEKSKTPVKDQDWVTEIKNKKKMEAPDLLEQADISHFKKNNYTLDDIARWYHDAPFNELDEYKKDEIAEILYKVYPLINTK